MVLSPVVSAHARLSRQILIMQKIVPFLWFNREAEKAARFYVSIFKNSKIRKVTHYGEAEGNASGQPKGSVMTVEFQLEGQRFVALNGGPSFEFTEAVSFVVKCRKQKEIDYFWKKLSAGGKEAQCGWLKDKFGLAWQIVPTALAELLDDKDRAKSQRVMRALLRMTKLNIKELRKAAKKG